ncbi:MAG TPA: XRE family transcriptional regulator [Actinobacteria bacterium]|nr:XRE family transcriptional regulator [Actinomycetota bacterium]
MGTDRLTELGGELRRLRTAAGLSGVRLAALAGVPQATVSRVETGNRVAGADVVIGLFAALGLEAGERDRLANLARAAYAGTAPRRVDAGVSFQPGARVRLEREARVVRSFESVIVPALLRTAEYRDAAGFPVDADGVGLAAPPDDSGRSFTFVLSESVLRTWPGSGECMPGQFAHLLAAAGRQGARLGVLPAALTGVPGRAVLPVHGFTLYDDSAVSVETFTRELTLTAEHDVRVYREVFGALERSAVFGREAREMVEHALLEYQKAPTSIH